MEEWKNIHPHSATTESEVSHNQKLAISSSNGNNEKNSIHKCPQKSIVNRRRESFVATKASAKHRQRKSRFVSPRSQPSDLVARDNAEIGSLLRVVEAQSRIRHSFSQLRDEIALKFNSMKLEDFLQQGTNILSCASQFSFQVRKFSSKEIDTLSAEMESAGFLHPYTAKMILVDRLLSIGIVKIMPAFAKLDLEDKKTLLQNSMPLHILCNAYCAYELGFDSFTRKDGNVPMIAIYKTGNFGKDQKLLTLAEKFFTHPVTPFTRVGVTAEEFALLLAICFAQSWNSDVSKPVKECLYSESVRYSQILFRYLQTRLGIESGAKRFMECISLVDHCFEAVHNHELFITYMEAFYRFKYKRMIREGV